MHPKSDSLSYRNDIVLVGGGHAHALVLLHWLMHPFSRARITLISEQGVSPYSGMLPGVVAGHYSADDIHIDLRRLCQAAGVRFVQARVHGIDPNNKRILLDGRPAIEYDVVSINAGITPDISVEGASAYAIPVKPISAFLPRWQSVLNELKQTTTPRTIAVVGGGAGSVELVLAMAHHMQSAAVTQDWLLMTRSPELLPDYPARLRRQLYQRLKRYGIRVMTATEVIAVDTTGVTTQVGQKIAAHPVFWCTQARPARWLTSSGLAVTPQGFLAVNSTLQSTSHPDVFAAGDCAWITQHALPRAGVYAVRQAPVLRENLQRHLLKQTLQAYQPQRYFLSLLACGGQDAVGARGRWSMAGTWVWHWKNRIDRRFMRMFQDVAVHPPLPLLEKASMEGALLEADRLPAANERCGGCGGKVSGDVLQRALAELDATRSDDTGHCPLAPAEDAAVIVIPAIDSADHAITEGPSKRPVLVQSVDALKPLFDDPWLFARVATEHALSDLFAMHAAPHSAQLLLQLPVLRERLLQRDLTQILHGVNAVLAAHGASLVGGHTLEADSLQIGLTVNAFAAPASLIRKRGANPGDVLILTKPLGTGALFAAAMRGYSQAGWIEAAIASMCTSNATAATILGTAGVHALTDVTGFGLAGHLQEMLGADRAGARLNLNALPVLPGVFECVQKGYESTLAPANHRLVQPWLDAVPAADEWRYRLLFDPQTSGGLLAAIAPVNVQRCLQMLQAAGVGACVIGECTSENQLTFDVS